jgi:hypothetical protein
VVDVRLVLWPEVGRIEQPTSPAKTQASRPLDRATDFCAKYGLNLPVMLAPMADAYPSGLSIAVANAGGMAAMGGLPKNAMEHRALNLVIRYDLQLR